MSTHSQATQPATYIRIHTDTLLRNYHCFTAGDVDIAPVVKANAYGHGAVGVARTLLDTGEVPFLVVASYSGAVQLREAGIEAPILVIGYVPPSVVADNKLPDITFTAVDTEHLQALEAELETTQPVHVKLDTGMNRYGFRPADLEQVIETLNQAQHVIITGVFSHLSDAFNGINDFTQQQIDRFNKVASQLTDRFASCQVTHLAATSGHSLRDSIAANAERIGIGLYGLANFTDEFHTEPVLSLVSKVASVRTITADDAVGYSRTYQPDGERLIATIPAGYFEGVDRRLSNCGVVRVGKEVCPIVGKVSMNATTIDVTECSQPPAPGDPVEIISADNNAPNSAAAIAETIDAVNYRTTTQLPARLPRVLV